MKIRTYFKLLYFVLFLTFSIIGVFTYFSFQRIKKLNLVDRAIHELYAHSLELRSIEGDYLSWDLFNSEYFRTGKSLYIDRFDSAFAQSMALCKHLHSTPISKKIGIEQRLFSLEKKLQNYQRSFHQLETEKRELGFKDWGIQGEMRRAIHQVENGISGINQPKLQVHMLMLRRHEKDYLMRRDLAYQDKFVAEQNAFIVSINRSGLTADQKNTFIEYLNHYKTTFLKLIEKDQYIGESQSQGLMAKLLVNINEIIFEFSSLNQSITQTIKSSIERIIQILLVFILICAFGATAIGALIFHSMIKLMGGEPEEVALIANNIARGNLLMKFDETKDFEGLMKSVVTMTRKITEIIANIYKSSDQVAKSSEQFTQSSQIISKGANLQASSIDQIGERISSISTIIGQNAADARKTGETSEMVKLRISEIKMQSDLSLQTNKTISQKINVINEITAQTKILALNAAVEAARAGIHGSGFHIIAEEVKRLAENTNQAAKEIGTLTHNSLMEAENVSQLVGKIIEPVSQSTRLALQISEASHEQNRDVQEISQTIQSLYDLSQSNAVASEEMAAGTTELEQQTRSLLEMVAYFNIGELHADDGRVISIKAHKNKKKLKKIREKD